MKRIYYILGVLFGVFFFLGCFDDENIHAELEYGRVYDSTSSDPVIKYISKFYFDYDKEIIIDPDTADYVYNFQNKNDLRIVPLKQERRARALDVVKELFFNSYSAKTIKNYFPVNVLVADSILDYSGWNPKSVDTYSATNFIAFAIDEGKLDLTEEQKYDFSLQMHLEYISKFCVNNDMLDVPNAFYVVSEKLYDATDKVYATLEEAYNVGFVEIVKGGYWDPCPSKKEDLQQWLKFLLITPQVEIEEIIEKYTAIRIKYEELSTIVKEMGIDFNDLVYKKKIK